MSKIIDGLPDGLNLEGIRPINSHIYRRDETALSPDGQFFATAFDIVEMTMMNEMGGVVWGDFNKGMPQIAGHLPPWSVHCWSRPFCAWVMPQVFVVKLTDKRRGWPLLAVHTKLGFQIVGAGGLKTRPSDISSQDISETRWSNIAPLE